MRHSRRMVSTTNDLKDARDEYRFSTMHTYSRVDFRKESIRWSISNKGHKNKLMSNVFAVGAIGDSTTRWRRGRMRIMLEMKSKHPLFFYTSSEHTVCIVLCKYCRQVGSRHFVCLFGKYCFAREGHFFQ